jgi:hypothetical protein
MAQKMVHELEQHAMEVSAVELSQPLELVDAVLNQISRVWGLDTPGTLPKARIVRTLLLQRLQNDLRCCRLLAEKGYPMQAASLAAGVYECWVNIAAIVDEPAASRWLDHDKETASFGSIWDLTVGAATIFGKPEKAKFFYSQYQQLCMPKHLNPLVEKERGFRVSVEEKKIQFQAGPDMSAIAIGHAWFSVERAARFAFMGILAFLQNDATPGSDELLKELAALRAKVEAVQDLSAERWPKNYFSVK